ncbi:MAG: pre-peptidase C-terminal domain-containing protein [Thermoplasmata archaeon]
MGARKSVKGCVQRKKEGRANVVSLIISLLLLTTGLTFFLTQFNVEGWSNGGDSLDPNSPAYGTHDWIVDRALAYLPDNEKNYIVTNRNAWMLGTELPDNSNLPGGIGDVVLHHVYYYASGELQDNASAKRAEECFQIAIQKLRAGNSSGAALYAGILSHYVVDVTVFGHVMAAGTDWGEEKHHSDYEEYVNKYTQTYNSTLFDPYIQFDGMLDVISAYDATLQLAYNTTFGNAGLGIMNCTWMDQNYNWGNSVYVKSAGRSLSLAINKIVDVFHTLALSADTTPPEITNVHVNNVSTATAEIAWDTNEPSTSVVEYGTTSAYGQTISDSSSVTSHSIVLSGLTASTTYHFRVKSVDAAGNLATSSDYTFTTIANSTDVIALTDGVAATGSLSAAKDAKYYLLAVGSGKTELKVELTGASGTDFDLYAKLGAKPTTSTYDYRSIGSTSTETINVTNPSAGDWYFMVYSYSGSGTFTIKATTSTSSTNVTQLTDGVAATGSLSASKDGKYYSITIPSGKAQLKIEMTGPSGTDFDVYVKLGAMPTTSSYDYSGTTSSASETVSITNPAAGTWYIYVYSYSGSGTFTIKASTSTSTDTGELTDGVAKTGSLSATGAKAYYFITIPSGKSQLKIELIGPSGTDFDLYVKNGANPSTSSYDYRSIGSTSTESITISSPSSGTWYILVYSYSGSGSFTIKATTEE